VPAFAGASGTTTTTAPLTLTQWKHSYETSVAKLADDALVVWSTGKRFSADVEPFRRAFRQSADAEREVAISPTHARSAAVCGIGGGRCRPTLSVPGSQPKVKS
jgi:hypothetical protein